MKGLSINTSERVYFREFAMFRFLEHVAWSLFAFSGVFARWAGAFRQQSSGFVQWAMHHRLHLRLILEVLRTIG
jgi:hypothetical protein